MRNKITTMLKQIFPFLGERGARGPSTVATDAVVGVVAPHHSGQMAVLLADGRVPIRPRPLARRRQTTGRPALGRNLPDHVLAPA
jgi:hypothetical protein